MNRRAFIRLLGGAATAWPLAARAQQPALPMVGWLGSASSAIDSDVVLTFRDGLNEAGFVAGRNVTIEYRWVDGRYDRLSALADEFVSQPVAVILAGGLPSALAAKAATATIPIVFVMGADPVTQGIVASLSRPGGNVTGISQFYGALGGKRLELLRELLPRPSTIAVLSNPNNPNAEDHLTDVRATARAMGQNLDIAHANSEAEIDAAFAGFARRGVGALVVADDPFFTTRRDQLLALAARYALPASYYARAFATGGGLISYGSSRRNNYYQAGIYTGRILKGAKPVDLPILQPTKFELVINLKTAKTLGIDIPPTLIARADEVIE
jgi:putative ABC transport system substrate-binding protein